MPGRIKKLITRLIHLRVGDNPHLEAPLKIKLIMMGIDPDAFDDNSEDDPVMMQRVLAIAKKMGYTL